MQVTNGDIWRALTPQVMDPPEDDRDPKKAEVVPFQQLLREGWPVKTSYWLVKMARELGGHYADLSKVRTDLIVRHGAIDEKGQATIGSSSPDWPAFVAEYNELMSETVEITANKITLPNCEELPEGKRPHVTPLILMALDAFVDVA